MRLCRMCGTNVGSSANCRQCQSPVPVRVLVLLRTAVGGLSCTVEWWPFMTLGQGVQLLLTLRVQGAVLPTDAVFEVAGRRCTAEVTMGSLLTAHLEGEPLVVVVRHADGSEFIAKPTSNEPVSQSTSPVPPVAPLAPKLEKAQSAPPEIGRAGKPGPDDTWLGESPPAPTRSASAKRDRSPTRTELHDTVIDQAADEEVGPVATTGNVTRTKDSHDTLLGMPAPLDSPGVPLPMPAAVDSDTLQAPRAVPSDLRRSLTRPAPTGELRRRASVRYFRRMNPARMFPLTVALSRARIAATSSKSVGHAVSDEMVKISARSPLVRVRPVLPGCEVYPSEQTVDVTPELVSARFQVVPQIVGTVSDARVELYSGQRLLSRVPLQMQVAEPTVANLMAVAGAVWPFVAGLLRPAGAGDQDAESPAGLAAVLLAAMGMPYATEIGLALIGAAWAGFYLATRPRESEQSAEVLGVRQMSMHELIDALQKAAVEGRIPEAVGLVEDLANVSPAGLGGAAWCLRQGVSDQRAVEILTEVRRGGVTDPELDWHLGTLLHRLGQADEAVSLMARAVEVRRELTNRFDSDPEVTPLRASVLAQVKTVG